MPYSSEQMFEIGRDPIRLRAYYWQVATRAKLQASKLREESRAIAERHPTTRYKPAFEEGRDSVHWADTLESFSKAIMDNIDAFVETTLESQPDKRAGAPSKSDGT